MKFDAFGTSKHGKENRYGKNFFAVLISTLGRFDRANKQKSVIYILNVGELIRGLTLARNLKKQCMYI